MSMSRPLLVAYDTPYAGSMRAREDGAYVRRDDPASLALALVALTADKDRTISDLEAQRDQLLQEIKELREQAQVERLEKTGGPW